MSLQAVTDGREVRQDQVDAGLVGLGEEHPAVDDQQPARVLEDGHIAADLAEPAERDDPQSFLGQRRRRGAGRDAGDSSGQGPIRRRAQSARSTAICSAVASTSGSRTGPAGSPSSGQGSLGGDHALGTEEAGVSRQQLLIERDRPPDVAGVEGVEQRDAAAG